MDAPLGSAPWLATYSGQAGLAAPPPPAACYTPGHPVLGSAVGGGVGAVLGLIVASALGTHYGDSRDSWARAIAAWKHKYPGFERDDDQTVIEAIDAQNNVIAGVGATLGALVGAVVGAWLGSGSQQPL